MGILMLYMLILLTYNILLVIIGAYLMESIGQHIIDYLTK